MTSITNALLLLLSHVQVAFNLGALESCVTSVAEATTLRFEEIVKAHLNVASIIDPHSDPSTPQRRLSTGQPEPDVSNIFR